MNRSQYLALRRQASKRNMWRHFDQSSVVLRACHGRYTTEKDRLGQRPSCTSCTPSGRGSGSALDERPKTFFLSKPTLWNVWHGEGCVGNQQNAWESRIGTKVILSWWEVLVTPFPWRKPPSHESSPSTTEISIDFFAANLNAIEDSEIISFTSHNFSLCAFSLMMRYHGLSSSPVPTKGTYSRKDIDSLNFRFGSKGKLPKNIPFFL